MPGLSHRSSVSPGHRDMNPTIKSFIAEQSHLEASPGGNFSSNFSADWLENTDMKIKIEEFDGALPDSQPRMTIDGTFVSPQHFYSSFRYSARSQATSICCSPPTPQARVFHAGMSICGRAPPKIPSSQKMSLPFVKKEPVPTTSPLMIKIEEFNGALSESHPRMTVDGTCTPPRRFYSSFRYSAGSQATSICSALPTPQARVFHAGMSIGGRAPPKIPSSQKKSLPFVQKKTVPTTSPLMVRTLKAGRISDQSSPEVSVRGNSTTAEVTVKRPQKRLEKTIQPPRSAHNTRLNQSISLPQYGAKPRGRPQKGSASRSENPMKKPSRKAQEELSK